MVCLTFDREIKENCINERACRIEAWTRATHLNEHDRSNRVNDTQLPSMKAADDPREPPTVGVTPRRQDT